MTREEAIKTLQELWRETNDSWYEETYKMAIEALSEEKTDGMTREEAIADIKNNIKPVVGGKSLDMAIEALHREEAEEKGYCHRILPSNVEVVVRCKDCRYYSKGENDSDSWALCTVHTGQYIGVDDDEFCSYGERSETNE